MKRCKVCGEVKPLDGFPRGSRTKDGRKALCKPCYCVRVKAERERDSEAINARRRIAYLADAENKRTLDRANKLKNRDAVLARKRAYAAAHAAEARAKTLQWRAENLEYARRAAREYQKAYPEKQWARNATRRARVRNAPVVEKVDRRAIIERDRSVCGICGEVVAPKDIHLDHIVPLFLGGTHTADNLRVTHQLCNLSRKREINN